MSKPKNENTLEMITSQNRYSHRVWFELSTQNKNSEKEKHLKAEGCLSTFEWRQGEQSLNLGSIQFLIQNIWTWVEHNFWSRIFEPGFNTIFYPDYSVSNLWTWAQHNFWYRIFRNQTTKKSTKTQKICSLNPIWVYNHLPLPGPGWLRRGRGRQSSHQRPRYFL